MVFKAVFLWIIVRAIVDHMLGRKQLRKLYRVSLSQSIFVSGAHKITTNTNSSTTLTFSNDSAGRV